MTFSFAQCLLLVPVRLLPLLHLLKTYNTGVLMTHSATLRPSHTELKTFTILVSLKKCTDVEDETSEETTAKAKIHLQPSVAACYTAAVN